MLLNIFKRLLSAIPTLLIVSIVLFIMMNVLPGDATLSAALSGADEAYMQRLRTEMGLDKPGWLRYLDWLAGLFRGDLGNSLISQTPVATILQQRLPVTLELTLLSMLVSVLIAVPMGILSAMKRNSPLDVCGSTLSMLGIAAPAFWMGMLMILVFSVRLHWLPASGFTSLAKNPVKNLRQMIMPAFSIGLAFTATVMRQTRSAMLEVIHQDYITTAYSKGIYERTVIWKHALRNALIPVLTVISTQIGRLIGGAVVVEQVFALPGIGRQIVDGILTRDYPVVMGLIMFVAAAVILINTLVDVLYILIDPRISHGKK